METIFIDIVESHMETFLNEIADRILDGWEINPAGPGESSPFANVFTVSLMRNEDSVANLKKLANSCNPTKLRQTRAEILENARAAKRAKIEMGIAV
jgi:hypothetical protein